MKKNIGFHILADMYVENERILQDQDFLTQVLLESLQYSGATYITHFTKKFSGGGEGVTVLVMLAESHISIHTSPEYKYAAVDYFTCGDVCNPFEGVGFIERQIKAVKIVYGKHNRGEI